MSDFMKSEAGSGEPEVVLLRRRVKELEGVLTRSAEAHLDLALQAARAGTWSWDLDTGKVIWSRELREMLDVRPEEDLSFESYLSRVPSEYHEVARQAIDGALSDRDSGGEYSTTHPMRRGDGKLIWIESRGRLLRHDDGRPARFLGVAIDVTERRTVIERLELLDESFRASPQPQLIAEWDGRVIAANEAAAEYTGRSVEELCGLRLHQILTGTRENELHEVLDSLAAGGRARFQSTCHHAGRPALAVEVVIGWHRVGAVKRVQLMIHDMRLLQAERKARVESERAYEFLVNSTPLLLWEAASDGAITFCNDFGINFFGLPMEELLGDRWVRVVHPDDLPWVLEQWNRCIESKAPLRIEYRAWRAETMTYEWHLVAAEPMLSPNGEVERWFGSSTNIELLKQQQQELSAALQEAEEVRAGLARSEQRFRSFMEHIPLYAFIKDDDLDHIYGNPFLLKRFGMTEDQFIGTSVYDMFDSATAAKLEASDRRVLDEGLPQHSAEFPIETPEGRRWLSDVKFPIPLPDGSRMLGGFAMDVTARREAESRLRESEQRLENAIEGARAGVWEWHLDTGNLVVNEQWAGMLGYTREELEPITIETFERLCHEEDLAGALAAAGDYLTGRTAEYDLEIRMRHKNGQVVWVVTRGAATKYNEEGEPVVMSGTHVDITSRKEQERKRAEFEKRMQQTQKLESLGVLAGGIAHDFNNILTSVMGNASLAFEEAEEDSPARERLKEIETAARRASELCHQMLAYSGRGQLRREIIRVGALVREMAALLKVSVSKNAELTLDLDDSAPAIEADLTQVRQVLMNLVINASEAIGDDGGRIVVTTRAVDADSKLLGQYEGGSDLPEGRYLQLTVADTGCGMEPDVVERLFEPFFTTKFTGRGLGLSAVLGIVRSHQGALKVVSKPNEGTTFHILLPESKKEKSATPPFVEEENRKKRGGCILVVDDDDTVRETACAILKRLGYTVFACQSGEEGISLHREKSREIDAVLLDLTMPGKSGIEVYSHLRAERPDVRVIMMSGFSEEDFRSRFTGEQSVDFLQKPFTVDMLRRVLEKVLDRT